LEFRQFRDWPGSLKICKTRSL